MMQGVNQTEVTLVPFEEKWVDEFTSEKERLMSIIGKDIVAIEHFGSTAIGGIATKPVIDILIGVTNLEDVQYFDKQALAKEKYYPLKSVEQKGKVVFAKFPALPDLRRTHYLHVVEHKGDWWNRHVHFRDTLKNNRGLAKEYEQLKKKLAASYPEDVRAYTEGKEAWIQSVEQQYK